MAALLALKSLAEFTSADVKNFNHFSAVDTLRKYASGIFLVSISAAMPP